jgi:hypothetical protein
VPSANTDLCQLVAATADLCRKPLRHAVLLVSETPDVLLSDQLLDCCLRLEVRRPDGVRFPEEDLELEIFQSGADLHLTLAWCADDQRPLLWQGSHPVWMEPHTGERCSRPVEGVPLESIARRLRSLLLSLEE